MHGNKKKRGFMKLSEIMKSLNISFDGEDIEINYMNTISNAKKGELSFVESARFKDELLKTKASAVLVSKELAEFVPKNSYALLSDNPRLEMAKATKFFTKKYKDSGIFTSSYGCEISKEAYISDGTQIAKNVIIYPKVFVGKDVRIEENVVIYPNVTIYDNSVIKKNSVIHAGSVVGSDGFGYVPSPEGHIKIYHLGNVVIEENVEIGANCAIDRGVFGSTIIKKGTKIDNLVHIAHNCTIGEDCFIAGQVGMAGSTKIGRGVSMGGQSGCAGHLEIGDFAQIAGKAGVISSIKGKKTYSGFPAMLHRDWLKLQVKLRRFLKG